MTRRHTCPFCHCLPVVKPDANRSRLLIGNAIRKTEAMRETVLASLDARIAELRRQLAEAEYRDLVDSPPF